MSHHMADKSTLKGACSGDVNVYINLKGMCDVSRDLFKFWEISDLYLEQDIMSLLPIPLNDLEGHFCNFQTFLTAVTRET